MKEIMLDREARALVYHSPKYPTFYTRRFTVPDDVAKFVEWHADIGRQLEAFMRDTYEAQISEPEIPKWLNDAVGQVFQSGNAKAFAVDLSLKSTRKPRKKDTS